MAENLGVASVFGSEVASNDTVHPSVSFAGTHTGGYSMAYAYGQCIIYDG